MNVTMEQIKLLQEQTGCNINLCKLALEKCSCIESAKECLTIKGIAVMRYHVSKDKNGQIIKIPFNDKDFVELAEELIREKFNEYRDK